MNDCPKPVDLYAEALLQIASEQGIEEQIIEDTVLIGTALRAAPDFLRHLALPSIAQKEKIAQLRKVFGDHVHTTTVRCMEQMVARGRTSLLAVLDETMQRVRNRREGIVNVEVRTARPVDEQQKRMFEKKIAVEFGRASHITYTCSPELIGGFQIRSPERRIDCSTAAGLVALRKALLEQ